MTPAQIASVADKINLAYHKHQGTDPAGTTLPDWLTQALDEALKDLPAPAAAPAAPQAKAGDGLVAVRYIGHRPTYKDGTYGTGIVFTKGESQMVPLKEAAQMLKHPDVYERGDAAGAQVPAVAASTKEDDNDPVQMLRDSVNAMSKAACTQYAKTHYSVELDQNLKVGEMRAKVIGLVDQFGLE